MRNVQTFWFHIFCTSAHMTWSFRDVLNHSSPANQPDGPWRLLTPAYFWSPELKIQGIHLCRETQTGEMVPFLLLYREEIILLIKGRVWKVLGELFVALRLKEFSLSCLWKSKLQFKLFLCELEFELISKKKKENEIFAIKFLIINKNHRSQMEVWTIYPSTLLIIALGKTFGDSKWWNTS